MTPLHRAVPALPDAPEDPVFVVGVPRSGTTVFATKLADATGRVMAPETHFMPEIWSKLRHLDLRDDSAAARAVARFEDGRWFSELGLKKGAILDRFLAGQDRDWPDLFRCVLEMHAAQCGQSLLGEKTPGHYRHVDRLLEWYPDCRVIFLFRDPRAVVASNIRAPFAPSFAWFTARRWTEFLAAYDRCSHDPRVSMLRYEDFVHNPDEILTTLADRLGRDDPDAGTGPGAPGSTSHGWRAEHLQAAARPVSTAGLHKWRKLLSDYEVWQVETETHTGMARFDYKGASPDETGFAARFRRDYPSQRLELAMLAAAQASGVKAALLRGLGRALVWAGYLGAERHPAPGPRVDVCLPASLPAVYPFGRPSAESEPYGAVLADLAGGAVPLRLVVRDRAGYGVALNLARFFGLREDVRIVRDRTAQAGTVQLWNAAAGGDAVFSSDLSDLTPARARALVAELSGHLDPVP